MSVRVVSPDHESLAATQASAAQVARDVCIAGLNMVFYHVLSALISVFNFVLADFPFQGSRSLR